MISILFLFLRTKHGADRVAKQLGKSGIQTGAIHSNRTQNQNPGIERFQGWKDSVLLTDIAARGIDVEGITHVVNLDFPPTPEDYIHRIGRTGRAKSEGNKLHFRGGPKFSPYPRAFHEEIDYSP